MRTTILLILAALAWIAYFASALAMAKHQAAENARIAPVKADYQHCVTIALPPLNPPRKIILYPRNSELS